MTAINPRTCTGFLELAANAVKVTETSVGSGENSVFVECVFVLNIMATEAQLILSTTVWKFRFRFLQRALKAAIFDLWTCLCVCV